MAQRKHEEGKSRNPWWFIGAALLFLATKGKTVLLLLGKFAGPLVSMAVTIGAYALISPVWFAVGFVLLILVHELGHVWAAKRKGLPVSAPLFIPFIGALITMKRHPKDAATEAYIALGGPLLGTLGAMAVYIAGVVLDNPLLFVLANVGFLINLFNLLPIHPLDGGRIATAVSRWLWVVGLVGGAIVLVYRFSFLMFLIWSYFAWNLYRTYIKRKKNNHPDSVTSIYEVRLEELNLPEWFLTAQERRLELGYNSFCRLTGEHIVQFEWEVLSFRGELELPVPGIVRRVELERSRVIEKDGERKLELLVRVEFERYENDRYYEVPPSTRWRFGLAYGSLALFLIAMMWNIHEIGLDVSLR
ncbi:site-2 protease family protein [Paenibacillus sp. SYP-B4298]|uniref:site-2 protease family protein n=1 Tax=Paenibacillus sp. SYP-B4298 TaxID=2996034 RepID=UPI0022DE06C8|nr:site-2 protease family protein [Paenibacillus sp. SYP-B4298]